MPSGLPLVHLHPVLMVEPWETSMVPASVRDRLNPTMQGKLRHKVCLHPHLEQGGTPPVERWYLSLFFLSYRWELTIPASVLWIVSWEMDRFDPQSLKKTCLIFLCDIAWPWYPLEDGEWWPVGGSVNYNTVLQLDQICRKQGKWVEVTYVLPFSLCKICQTYVLRV